MIRTFVSTLLAVALVLGAYEWYRQRQAATFAQQVTTEAGRIVDERLASAEASRHTAVAAAKAAAYITEGFVAAGAVKVAIAEYFQVTGDFASSNDELRLPLPDEFRGHSLTSLNVSEGGIITLTYDEKSGVQDGTVTLIPDESNPVMGIRWQCESRSYKDIAQWAPQCRYTL